MTEHAQGLGLDRIERLSNEKAKLEIEVAKLEKKNKTMFAFVMKLANTDIDDMNIDDVHLDALDIIHELTMRKLKRVCAWHPKYFGTELVIAAGEGPVSHGICPKCAEIMKQGIKRDTGKDKDE